MVKITKRLVDGLKPQPDKDVWTFDDALTGFAIRMKPSGSAAYYVQYRAGGQGRRLMLGKVGTLTPDEARKRAREALASAARGDDPHASKMADRRAMTVAELCAAYFKDADAGHVLGKGGHPKKASTLKTDKSRVASHVIPLIGARTVISLTRADIEKLQRDITDGRARRARGPGRGGQVTGGHGAASRTLGCFGAILAWAVRQGIITASPAVGVRRHADGQRERVLGVDELAALAAAIAASDAHPVGLAAIRLALLTGFRKSEVLTLLWVWVDLAAQCIRLGSHKTMTMTPGAGAQVRPVGYAACELLRAQPRYPGCPYVFPATRAGVAGHFVGAPKLLATLCERAGIDGVTLHTLRHTFASVAAELGYSELVIAALLGHRGGSVTRRYVHLPDPLLVSAADAVSARIATLCRG